MSGLPSTRRFPAPIRRDFLRIFLTTPPILAISACSPAKFKESRAIQPMGERIVVGKLTFVVLESKWDNRLGELATPRMPKHQFLQVRLSVTNGGGSNEGFPFLALLDEHGARIPELEDGAGVTDWLGLIRTVGAGETLMGWVLFDVPQTNYNLQLSNGNLDDEQTAIVEIPLRLG